MFTDKTLTCRDCGAPFTFTASEQEFFAEKGFTNEPTRCSSCRATRRNGDTRNNRGTDRNSNQYNSRGSQRNADRPMYDAVCDSCGVATKVPFMPRGDKPVYCRDCFNRMNPR
ncbi:MAG: zinc-ribbon domain containing protein [Firmicutes bacterium]|nr:zinc-ribbon domain containing protein [Bacillota bacterium]